MKSVVFLDLDGTFWMWGVVPTSAVEAVRRAQANGHKVLCNTGRSRSEVQDLATYGLDGYCFAAGSDVFMDGLTLLDARLSREDCARVERLLYGWGVSFVAEGREQSFTHLTDTIAAMLREEAGGTADLFLSCPDIADMTEDDYAQVCKYCIIGSSLTQEQQAQLPKGLAFTDFNYAGEITQREFDKAISMETVRAHLERTTGELWRTMAFGDSDNDIPMLRAADVGVCMGNGNDNAKAAADYVTAGIDDDGLYLAFQHFGLV